MLSLASVAAQGVLYWLNGSRIALKLRWSMTGPGGFITLDLDKTDHFPNLMAQGYMGPYLAVEVTNKGRGETNIVGVKAVLDSGIGIIPTSVSVPFNPSFPDLLRPHSQVTLHVPHAMIEAAAKASRQVLPAHTAPFTAKMEVAFGNGKKRTTKASITVPR